VSGRYLAPDRFTQRIANPIVRALGFASTLTVTGRKTGTPHKVPVNVLTHDGARYLVAPRGDTQWVRNLRAAGEGEVSRRGHHERVRATEVADVDKPPLIEAYLAKWGSQVKSQFKELPDPGDHPVFRIDPVASTP
jgi:deazaflavin-dependent oxidoreductase (nitroreductase family)